MVKEVSWPQLKTYERKPYFYTEGTSTGVVFTAPANGATTDNSDNPRSELRQMLANGDPAAWSNKTATWSVEGLMAFTALPSSTQTVVGMQLHDNTNDLTVLRLEGSDLYITQGNNDHFHHVTSSYTLGTFMKVKLESRKGGGVRWYINDVFEKLVYSGTFSGCYYKVGAYTQQAGGAGSGQVIYKTLKVWKS